MISSMGIIASARRHGPRAAALVLIAIAGQAHAGFLGDAMTPTYQYPALGTVYPASSWSPASFIVGAGQETDGNIEGVTCLNQGQCNKPAYTGAKETFFTTGAKE